MVVVAGEKRIGTALKEGLPIGAFAELILKCDNDHNHSLSKKALGSLVKYKLVDSDENIDINIRYAAYEMREYTIHEIYTILTLYE